MVNDGHTSQWCLKNPETQGRLLQTEYLLFIIQRLKVDCCNQTIHSAVLTCHFSVPGSLAVWEQKEHVTLLLWFIHCRKHSLPPPQAPFPKRMNKQIGIPADLRSVTRNKLEPASVDSNEWCRSFVSQEPFFYLLRGFKATRLNGAALCCADHTQRRHCLPAKQETLSVRGGNSGERLKAWVTHGPHVSDHDVFSHVWLSVFWIRIVSRPRL